MRYRIVLVCLIGLIVVTSSCNYPSQVTPTVGGVDFIRTAAARTLDAVSTTMAAPGGGSTVAVVTSLPIKTALPNLATQTVTPKPAQGTPTNPLNCDQVTFVRDITIPDGALLPPGTSFTKTWVLKNSGSCPWNSNYLLVFANEGDLMGGTISKPLVTSGTVPPGELVRISVDLKAPAAAGDYKGHWRLRNPGGADFAPGGKTFWVAIKVKAPNKTFLMDNMCFAIWRNASGDLNCPGKAGDAKGSITRVDTPKFSTGYEDNEPAFQLEPQQVNDGMIVGEFPPYPVNAAQPQFRTVIACAFDAKACDTKVTITGQAGTESEQVLGEWNVSYKNDWVTPRIDLTTKGWAGKSVVLRFYVRANGPASQDRVLFLSPIYSAP